MHLVRATAIEGARAEGCPAIELGGVDLPGHRQPPEPGDPNRGLYEHKRGFGARWVERESPYRIVLRPGVERLARARRRAIDTLEVPARAGEIHRYLHWALMWVLSPRFLAEEPEAELSFHAHPPDLARRTRSSAACRS